MAIKQLCCCTIAVVCAYNEVFIGLFISVIDQNILNNNTTTIVLWPFVRDYLGEPVPEEIFTHPPS